MPGIHHAISRKVLAAKNAHVLYHSSSIAYLHRGKSFAVAKIHQQERKGIEPPTKFVVSDINDFVNSN